METVDIPEERVRPLRRAEYDRLVEMGQFEGERIELLYGRIVAMSPQGDEHAGVIARLSRILTFALGDRAWVLVQSPFVASDTSEPEPDLAVVPPADGFRHPDRAHLIVEVAATSQRQDRGPKGALYAASGVQEYWVVDVPARRVERYTTPLDGRYAESTVHGRDGALRLLAFPDVEVVLARILPP